MPMTLEFKRRVKELDNAWKKYLELLTKSKIMIETSKVKYFYSFTHVLTQYIVLLFILFHFYIVDY